MHPQSKTFQVERRGNGQRSPMKAPKPRAWSHQDDLKALKGERISIFFADSRPAVSGILAEADQFTIRLETGANSAARDYEIFFKSALRSFRKA